jgi:hypothetical protein
VGSGGHKQNNASSSPFGRLLVPFDRASDPEFLEKYRAAEWRQPGLQRS